jgi:1-acyl-sn-glycerol-3-phosphate acyltransferase
MSAPRLLEPAALLPALPPSLPRRRFTALERWLGRTAMRAFGFGWRGGFPDCPRMVLIAAPHTSNWDGVVGLGAVAVAGVRLTVYGKRELFVPPLGWMLRRYGAIPVDRRHPGGVVERAAERFADGRPFLLGMTPEGTRSKVADWKTGFHRIAVEAGVPVAVVALDWGRREIAVSGTFEPSGDLAADLAAIGALLDGVQGRRPALQTIPTADGGF